RPLERLAPSPVALPVFLSQHPLDIPGRDAGIGRQYPRKAGQVARFPAARIGQLVAMPTGEDPAASGKEQLTNPAPAGFVILPAPGWADEPPSKPPGRRAYAPLFLGFSWKIQDIHMMLLE